MALNKTLRKKTKRNNNNKKQANKYQYIIESYFYLFIFFFLFLNLHTIYHLLFNYLKWVVGVSVCDTFFKRSSIRKITIYNPFQQKKNTRKQKQTP